MRMRLWKRTCWTVGGNLLGEAGEVWDPFGGFEGSDDFDVYYDDGDDDEPLIGGVMNDTSHDAFNAGVNGRFSVQLVFSTHPIVSTD